MRVILLLFLLMGSGPVLAEFSEQRRSINGTGETLAEKEWQVALNAIHYGLTDSVTAGFPFFSLITAEGSLEIRKKIPFYERWRFTATFSVGPTPFPDVLQKYGFDDDEVLPWAQLGSDVGIDLGAGRQHSINGGLDLRYTKDVADSGESRPILLGDLRFAYDYYQGGNVYYLGWQRLLPYAGITWAWRRVHIGVVSSPLSYFIPLPYLYLRF